MQMQLHETHTVSCTRTKKIQELLLKTWATRGVPEGEISGMYLETVESFLIQAEDLYRSNPLQTRYSLKYRHCDQKLVAKITDDVTCLQYKTDKVSDVKKLEQLNNTLFDLMSGMSSDVKMT